MVAEYGPDFLDQCRDVLRSRMGAFFPGSHVVFRGKDLHHELNELDWFELYLFSITGRHFSEAQCELLQAIWSYTSYPDVRLWNNRVAAMAANNGSTGNLGLAAALAVSEASIYGRGIDKRAIDFLLRTRKALTQGCYLQDCIKTELTTFRSIAGYGRPLINGDERNPHILALAKSLGLDRGKHLELAFGIERMLLEGRWRMKMNYAGVCAALVADMGMDSQEYYRYLFPAFLAGMTPCQIEAEQEPAGGLYPARCEDINYQGVSPRNW